MIRLSSAASGVSPEASALAVYLHASERGLTGPRRMILQVGMQATPRHSGRRPVMNVGVVFDLRGEVSAQGASSLRALIESLAVLGKDVPFLYLHAGVEEPGSPERALAAERGIGDRVRSLRMQPGPADPKGPADAHDPDGEQDQEDAPRQRPSPVYL